MFGGYFGDYFGGYFGGGIAPGPGVGGGGFNGGFGFGTGTAGVKYRMRAFDSVLLTYVFWTSSSIDSAGADYTGPGTPSDIVVQTALPPAV